MTTTYATVWDAIADTPEEAAAMKRRADVMMAITGKVAGWKVTQREAASRLGITQPRLNELLNGRISSFSLDALTALAERAGLVVKIAVRDPGDHPRPHPVGIDRLAASMAKFRAKMVEWRPSLSAPGKKAASRKQVAKRSRSQRKTAVKKRA